MRTDALSRRAGDAAPEPVATSWLPHVEDQRGRLNAALGALARDGERYALVDFPDYPNVGDSAIWLGAAKMLRKLTGAGPVYVCTKNKRRLAALAARIGSGTIYISGGGNLGDLWIDHQEFREALLEQFPSNRIVQLPQSIHFGSEEAAARCAGAIARHKDFHLLVRDESSRAFAERRFDCPVTLAPDCAFALGRLPLPAPPRHMLCCLLRTDKEGAGIDRSPFEALTPCIGDWLDEPPMPVAALTLRAWRDAIRSREPWRSFAGERLFELMARRRLERGIGILARGARVATDRLHGHLLCLMLGIPHAVLGDRYGKIEAYRRTWPGGEAIGPSASDAEAAVAALAGLPMRS